jgi:hypothetical protein
MKTQAGNGDQSDGSRDDVSHLLQLMLKPLVVGNDFAAGLIKKLALTGQGKLLASTLEKRNTKADFNGAQLLTYGRLGNAIEAG